ncbi:MAG: response regulator [Flavobacteriales bacterium]|nr:response regulator [Flavobacteriales bacterium]
MEQPFRILLVDDDEATLYLHRFFLQRHPAAIEVSSEMDGFSALNKIKELLVDDDLPDALLLDLNMPKLSGWELLDALIALNDPRIRQMRIVLISTSANPDDHNRAKAHPLVSSFIAKPLKKDEVNVLIDSLETSA